MTVTDPTTTPATDHVAGPVYELRDVWRTFGQGATEIAAVREVDLTIAEGELVALVGASGSGKTTLLQLLGALDRPTRGAIRFEGRDLAGLRDSELGRIRLEAIGFVFQQFNLIPTLTAAQNVEVALAPSQPGAERRRERVSALLESVGLAARGEHLPGQLSGGEQQRVAIARALANGPRVILADEPTGNLDSETGEGIIDLLTSLSETQRQTIVLITHDRAIASRARRVVGMRDGRLEQEVADEGREELAATGRP
jgi:putative ABC transport system ATP-binding protein